MSIFTSRSYITVNAVQFVNWTRKRPLFIMCHSAVGDPVCISYHEDKEGKSDPVAYYLEAQKVGSDCFYIERKYAEEVDPP